MVVRCKGKVLKGEQKRNASRRGGGNNKFPLLFQYTTVSLFQSYVCPFDKGSSIN